MCIDILKAMYSHMSGRVKAYGTLPRRLDVSRSVRQGSPIYPFLFNFAMDDILEDAFQVYFDIDVDMLQGSKLLDFAYSNDIALLFECPETAQRALDNLSMSVRRFCTRFASAECQILSQGWQGFKVASIINGEGLGAGSQFVHSGSIIGFVGGMNDEIKNHISNARMVFANPLHFWL